MTNDELGQIDHDPAVYCAECGEPCEIDDGRVSINGPPAFPPSSACCGAELLNEDPDTSDHQPFDSWAGGFADNH